MTTKGTDNTFRHLQLLKGTTPSTPVSGKARLFVDSGSLALKWVDDDGTVYDVGGGGSSDLDAIIAASSGQDIADALAGAAAPDAGNVFATMADVGSVSSSFLGYNTVGGSTQTMTQKRVYAKQITAGGSGNYLMGIQAYVDQTAEAAMALGFFLHADSGSDTIGDLLAASLSNTIVLAHGTGGGISYPARWFGMPIGYPLAASTKYWIGVVYNSGTGAPRLYYDGSGSDRYYDGGATPYYNDGAYGAGSQTNTSNKHSIRALVS